jgi:membrane protease subunit (stomatin/prohibitin family)
MRRAFMTLVIVGSMGVQPVTAHAQFQMLGGALGAAVGGQHGVGGAFAGAIIGVAMGTILQQLSQQEQSQRQASLQRAARSGKSTWTSKGKSAKKATYTKVGAVQNVGGKQCQKVRETITLADGKQGTSDENVCFS